MKVAYLKEAMKIVVKDDAKGVGPFLLAYTEMRRAGLIEA